MFQPLIHPVEGNYPRVAPDVFIAPTSVVVGDVEIGSQASIWFQVVLRGDVNSIQIGAGSNIQDGAIVHCTYQTAPTRIGSAVTVGHGAIVHGCTIEDHVLIGMGAIVMDYAYIPSDTVVAAGALIRESMQLESGSLYAGVPARKVKDLSPEQIAGIRRYAILYRMYADWFRVAGLAQPLHGGN